jgi:phage terminase large subunit-like protein
MTTLVASDPVTEWAEEVADGWITSGQYGRLACQRHLNDLKYGKDRGLEWRPEAAIRALKFFPSVLKVTAGAKAGEPFNLPSYTKFVVGSLYGWYRKDSVRLRFRSSWVETGKGQIKSPVAAALGLYNMGFRGIPRAECYAIAKDRNQANVLFGDASAMALAEMPEAEFDGESLVSRGTIVTRGTGDMIWMLEHPESGSKFRSLAGDERINGPRPTYVAADEIHEWKSDGALKTWKSAGAKMPGDFLLWMSTNTPAADQPVATEWSQLHQRILRGEAEDDSAFAFIARIDPGDKPFEDERCWQKSMPCLGITFPIENVRIEVNSARNSVGMRLSTERLYFGVPVGSSEYWIDLDFWEAVQGEVDIDNADGADVYLTLDLSKKNDLTALGMGWVDEKDVLHATVEYWKPAEKLKEKAEEDHAQYVEWAASAPPLLNLVPGRSIEYEFIAELVRKIAARHHVAALVVDPAFLTDFRKACDNVGLETWVWEPDGDVGSGLKIIIHGQGRLGMQSKKALWMPRSLQKFEDRILQRRIIIDESPITKWCSGNAAVQPDAQNNRFFIKKHQRGRIDGMTVLAMLAGAADLVELGERSAFDGDEDFDDLEARIEAELAALEETADLY